MKILTTHVGSLPRTQRTVDFIFAKEKKQKFDQNLFDKAMKEGVMEVVEKQNKVGIDIVSDGETSKISYATYVKDRYDGFDGDSPRNAPKDLKLFPGFLKRISDQGGTPEYSRPMCVGEIRSKNNKELDTDIENLLSAMKKKNIKRGFMNAASPGVISLFLKNNFYESREKYLIALGNVMSDEYKSIVEAGLDLQIDCPDLALSRHMLFEDLSDDEFLKIAEMHIDILNGALKNLPPEKIRIHICWGNYEGPHVCDIPMSKMFDTLMKAHANYVLFETSNPRHQHEWRVFEENKNKIPSDKILVPGVLDTTTNFVEHPMLVSERLGRFIKIVGKERVIAGTDCGFGTFAGFGSVDPDIAYEKLKSLCEGAEIAQNNF